MTDDIKPNGTQFEGKEEYVKDVFTEIASYYDEMNDIMSLGMVQGWHRFMLKKGKVSPGMRCLDVGTGTGEIAFGLSSIVGAEGSVTAVDITPKMVELAQIKMKDKEIPKDVDFVVGDALGLDFADGTFDVVTSGYMLRNVTDLQKAIDEMHRVLKVGGTVIVAEMATPDNRFVKYFYDWYMEHRVKKMGRRYDRGKTIDGRQPAYDWLTQSIKGFPHGKTMVEKFVAAGFTDARYYGKTFGAVNFYIAKKN